MRTKIRVYFSLFLFLVAATEASAQNMGRGKVDFGGEIVVVPCGLAMESQHQLIDLGDINATATTQPQREVKIQLVDCELARKDQPGFSLAQVAFYGMRDATYPDQIGLQGEAKGVHLSLLNQQRQKISLGKTLSDYEIVEGDNTLRFFTELRINQREARAGHFAATLQFIVSYF
ncbi:MAG: type 1 fimbrial protein [Neisseriaceae bacterium]|nr:type 1 fimbrial protein [Neisseriaceae bacterium]